MKLSSTTLDILKNFSAINPNMLFKPGHQIGTIAEAKNIIASASIEEEIPTEFGIYDLTELLSILSLMGDAEIDFGEDSLQVKEGPASTRYFYSGKELLTVPTKNVTMPKAELTITLTEDHLNRIRKAASVLGHSNLEIQGQNGVVTLRVVDPKNSTANSYNLVVDQSNACTENFSFVMVIGNLKIIPGDYTVSISSKLISCFKNQKLPLTYWIALEKTSTYGN